MLSRLITRLVFPGSLHQHPLPPRFGELHGVEVLYREAHDERFALLQGGALLATGAAHPQPESCPWLVFCYGNAMSLQSCLGLVDLWRRQQLNVLVPEYAGYGGSSGEPSEAGCYAAAEVAYEYLSGELHVPAQQIVASGWSLGSAVAVQLAATRAVAGLALLSGLTTLPAVARHWVPCRSLIKLLIEPRFDAQSRMAEIRCPLLLVHGMEDRLLPYSMAEQLAHNAVHSPRVELMPIPRAGHNDLFDVGGSPLADCLGHFVRQSTDAAAPACQPFIS